jgi:hypothetical protein
LKSDASTCTSFGPRSVLRARLPKLPIAGSENAAELSQPAGPLNSPRQHQRVQEFLMIDLVRQPLL